MSVASRTRKWICATVAALAAISGCTAQHVPPPPGADAARAPSAELTARAVLTLTGTSLRQEWDIARAQQQFVVRCMNSQGLRYLTSSQGPEPTLRTVTATALGSGRPATYGITLGSPGGKTGPGPEDQYVSRLPGPARTRYTAAYSGTAPAQGTLVLPSGMVIHYGTSGCLAQARAELFGSVRAAIADMYLPADTEILFDRFLDSDRPYLTTLHIWQHCMATAGWHFATPRAAILSIASLAARPGTSATKLNTRQTALADQDVTCNAHSQLRAHTQQQLTIFLSKQPGPTLTALRDIYRTRQRAVAIATKSLR
jgi:hypothetical protein